MESRARDRHLPTIMTVNTVNTVNTVMPVLVRNSGGDRDRRTCGAGVGRGARGGADHVPGGRAYWEVIRGLVQLSTYLQ